MERFTETKCRSFVYYKLLARGWLPPGTDRRNWHTVTTGQLHLDDPPLPSDPHYQKRKAALDLQDHFIVLGGAIPSPLPLFKKLSTTLGELAKWCYDNQAG